MEAETVRVGAITRHELGGLHPRPTLTFENECRAAVEPALDFLERELGGRTWLLGEEFSAADVMMGFTLIVLTKDLLGFSELVINRGFSVGTVGLIAFYEIGSSWPWRRGYRAQ